MDPVFSSEYTVLNPSSSVVEHRAAHLEGMWVTAAVSAAMIGFVAAIAATFAPASVIGQTDGTGACFAVGAAVGAFAWLSIVVPRLWRSRRVTAADHVITVRYEGYRTHWTAESFAAFNELGAARDQIRDLALDEHGHLISDEALVAVEAVRFAAARAAEHEAAVLERRDRLGGSGPEIAAMRDRLTDEAAAAAALVDTHVALGCAMRDAASEMYAAFDALGDTSLAELATRRDRDAVTIDDARAHIDNMVALAGAARELIAVDAVAALEAAAAASG